MASSGIEDEDLIDLEGADGACVSSRTTVPEASTDELEHLLDVCPPQLEQKLSLTRKQELVREHTDNGDVLVTLGHDQVVPNRKRIDVVSSETIKRVRNITKNLEPVIRSSSNPRLETDEFLYYSERDAVDGNPTKSRDFHDRPEVTDEAQAISNAFNFLSDLDDAEDDEPPPDKRRRRDSSYKDEEYRTTSSSSSLCSYPLEPTCLIENQSNRYRDIERANRDIEATDRTSVIDPHDSEERVENSNHDNPGFDVSPGSKISQQKEFDSGEIPFSKSFLLESAPRFTRLWDDAVVPRCSAGQKIEDRVERKSWSDSGYRLSVVTGENGYGFERSTSTDIECPPEPSTSNGIKTYLRRSSGSIARQQQVPEQSASSSECSEVDWSWVEEYEYPPDQNEIFLSSSSSTSSKIHQTQTGNKTSNITTSSSSTSCPPTRPASAPTRVPSGTTITNDPISFASSSDVERERMRSGEQLARDSNGSVAMSVGATGKFPPSVTVPSSLSLENSSTDCCTPPIFDYNSAITNNHNGTNNATIINGNLIIRGGSSVNVDDVNVRSSRRNNGASASNRANSWVRASMRRIRHLRLPDAERNAERRNVVDAIATASAPILSAPNSLPDIALIAPEILVAHTNGINTGSVLRPSSAPVATRDHNSLSPGRAPTPRRGRRHRSRSRGGRSQERANRVSNGARNGNSNVENSEIGVQTRNSTSASTPGRRNNNVPPQNPNSPAANSNGRRVQCERQRGDNRDNERGDDDDEDENPLGRWPHPLSPALACLGCTLGLFNISRFAILSTQFGANFIIQFLVLSLILGIPLLTLQVCLGQRLSAGAVDMWRISPIFHGVGIALLIAQAFIGIYSIIGVSWMFAYFRDSFITKQERYRWAESFSNYRDYTQILFNKSINDLQETVPDYFSGIVLQRHHSNEPESGIVTLKFQVAFNLAVVWMIVFVSLSKGLRSYGKVIYVFTLIPVCGTLLLCTKLLGLTPPGSIHQLFPATVWSEFFINSKSWVAASSEVFLTWGVLGAAAMQIAAHNKHKHLLQRDTSLVVVLTLVVLLLSAFLANTCVQILRHYGYTYMTSSFEKVPGYTFMRHVNQPQQSAYSNTPERFMSHSSFLLGQRVVRPGADLSNESGYQVLRLSTELVPATLAILGTEQVSPFWAVLFYFILILFGIAQQLAIWHCVITGIMAINTKMMKAWETTITFFSCACGYLLGLPMATDSGIFLVYYLDYVVGGAWWIMVLYLVQVGAVFAVRGRPHTGETVVAELFPPTGRCLRYWAGPLLSFTWNVVLPVALMVLSITVFKSSNFRELYAYGRSYRDYWPVWARQLGAAIQLATILVIPGVAVIQTCRYLNSGPPDFFDRIQLLYRPHLDADDTSSSQIPYGTETSTSIHGNGILPSSTEVPFEDPPPKYTPPPSYTTATGARIAKMLRQSFRRSVRRIASVLGESSVPRTRPALQPPPPDYATVLVEMNQSILSENITVHVTEPRPDVTDTSNARVQSAERNRPNTIDRMTRISTIDRNPVERTHSTMDRGRRLYGNNSGSSNLTAADVANLLRSSIRRGTARTQQSLCRNTMIDTTTITTSAASIENLVNAAAPISEDSLVFDKDSPLVREPEDDDDKKTVNETDNSVSVI